MRIAIGQLWQETNTFNPLPTTLADFDPLGVHRGAELVEKMAEVNELGGFIQTLRSWPQQPEIVGLVRYAAWPSGPVAEEAIDRILANVLGALQASLPVDGVLLALHGSMAAENRPDVEGDLLEQVRELVGPKIPVVATLDLHANVTAKMVRHADALVVYRTVPHVDVFQTGQHAADIMWRIIVDGAQPVTVCRKLPMVVPAERANTQDPRSVSYTLQKSLEYCQCPRVLTAGLTTVQPWLDVPELGSSVLVTTDGNLDLARRKCDELAEKVWQRRRAYLPKLIELEDAVERAYALRDGKGLVVLSDAADATNSGSTGEATAFLHALAPLSWPKRALATFVDATLVADAASRESGARWQATFGGRCERRFSQPLSLEVELVRSFDAKFTLDGHIGRNMPIDMGPAVVLRHWDLFIVVVSRSGPLFAPELFEAAGFDPFAASLLVAKSPCGFRAAYQHRAKLILLPRTPGCAPSDFWNYEYRRIPRPLWPWDDIDSYDGPGRVYCSPIDGDS